MALMNLGIVATDIRGSVAGTVFSRNNGGAITRARVKPVNPRTPAQTAVRANFGGNSRLWSGTMTADQRAAWTFFAQANPQVNRLGQSIVLSGLAMQQRLNQVLVQIGSAPIIDPPADMSVGSLPDILDWTALVSTGDVQADTDAQAAPAGTAWYISATGLLAPGQKPPQNGYRFMAAYAPTAAATNIIITAEWTAKFGALIEGKTLGIAVQRVNTATGALTPRIITYVTVGA